MKRTLAVSLFLAAATLSAAAVAAPKCTNASQEQWMTEAAMKQKVLDQGYTIKVFKVSGNCYEIYGMRHKLGPGWIRNLRGIGYAINPPGNSR